MSEIGAELAGALSQLPELVAFRGLPYFGFVLCARGYRWSSRIAAAFLCACTAGLALRFDATYAERLPFSLLCMLCYVLAATIVWRLPELLRRRVITKGAAMVLCGFAFIALPPMLEPRLAVSAAQVLGWELALGAYSYTAETARREEKGCLRECLFFLFVTQTLVYSHRGHTLPAGQSRSVGLWRVMLGLGVLWLGLSMQALAGSTLAGLQGVGMYTRVLCVGLAMFIVQYAGHSGRASLSIGTMRVLGYRIPERYHYPYLASTPEDFWRRWNSYVGTWFRLYVYLPLSRELVRARWGHAFGWLASGAALVLTFVLVGVIHDVETALRTLHNAHNGTMGFAAVAAIVLGGTLVRRTYVRIEEALPRYGRVIARCAARLIMLHLIAFGTWFLLSPWNS